MKIFSILLICFLYSCSVASAQSGYADLYRKSESKLGFITAVDLYQVRFISPMTFDNSLEYKINTGYSYGILSRSVFPHRIGIRQEIKLAQRSYSEHYTYIYIDPNDPFIPVKITTKATYLDITLGIEYFFLKKEKLKMFISASTGPGILLKEREITEYESGALSNFKKNKLNKNLMMFPLSLGIEQKCSKRLYFTMEAHFRVYANTLQDNMTITNPIQYGVAVSLSYLMVKIL